MDDLIDEGIEDRVLGVKIDMQDFAKGEIANVEDTIMKHFEDGRISLQFKRCIIVSDISADTPDPQHIFFHRIQPSSSSFYLTGRTRSACRFMTLFYTQHLLYNGNGVEMVTIAS